ncbi:acyl-CoA dehydrogenase [Streptomyces sp. NBC_01218]|uniref:acyl-CoA dehydrogenase n=1 Tax=unclassified Streptomyces TaxID=2593676 RepID=UPI0023B9A472|nr:MULTISPECIES: acyl-CoA dehydrogenase [unclassified Streptomyces]WEH39063.1 acyl-CoA dehydrogenase [Streptomyces sp. AM 2-1-1]WSQ50719.1 acyl-CoA dehydrogenase [Streptomyces sp. NBC_01218]
MTMFEHNDILAAVTGRDPQWQPDRLTRARARVAEIEDGLGDPWSHDNPVGLRAVLANDESGDSSAVGIRRFQSLGMPAELVPEHLGGRMAGADLLGFLMRPFFRRDPALAFSHGFTPFLGAQMVWLNGDSHQRSKMANVVLRGGTVGVACQRFEHESEFHAQEYSAAWGDDGMLRLNGRKSAINNAHTAELIVGFVSTGDGAAEYSILMFDPATVPPARVRALPRHRTTGARSVQAAGLEFVDCPLPGESLVGTWGDGVALSLRAFPAAHATFPSMIIGLADTALRAAVRAEQEREPALAGSAVDASARSALAGTFADLLIADCLSLTAGRSVHLMPDRCDVLTAVTKYIVPKIVSEALYDLSAVMGDAFHAESGHDAVFRKQLRDLSTLTFGHVSSAICQSVIAPYLPSLAAGAAPPAATPADLFRLEVPLPAMDGDRLATFGGGDGLLDYLGHAAARLPEALTGQPYADLLTVLVDGLCAEVAEIRREAGRLSVSEGGMLLDNHSFPLSERYALVLAASACTGVWLNAGAGPDEFLADPTWLTLALHRLLRRVGASVPPLPRAIEGRLSDEVLDRVRVPHSLDLLRTGLAG